MKWLLSIVFLLTACQTATLELGHKVVCVEDEESGLYCYDTRYAYCHCSDSSCMCNTGYHFDLEDCGCVKDEDQQGFWEDYQKGLESYYGN
jgi:hypothetical protein